MESDKMLWLGSLVFKFHSKFHSFRHESSLRQVAYIKRSRKLQVAHVLMHL